MGRKEAMHSSARASRKVTRMITHVLRTYYCTSYSVVIRCIKMLVFTHFYESPGSTYFANEEINHQEINTFLKVCGNQDLDWGF